MVGVADVLPSQRPLRQSVKEDWRKAERNTEKHDLAGRYFCCGPLHEDEIASPNQSEQCESNIGRSPHFITSHHGNSKSLLPVTISGVTGKLRGLRRQRAPAAPRPRSGLPCRPL